MHPAQQRLHPVIRARREVHDRLVEDLELFELERALELGLELEPFHDALVHLRLEHAVASFAVSLRHVHGDVCIAE